jgi:cell division protein FtsB
MDKGLKRIFVVGIIGTGICVAGPNIYRSYIRLTKLKIEREELTLKKEQYVEQIRIYDEEIEKLKQNFYREKIAREKLFMIKEGEKIIRINKK